MAFTVTRHQSSSAPLGCGGAGIMDVEPTNLQQVYDVVAGVPAPCRIYAANN